MDEKLTELNYYRGIMNEMSENFLNSGVKIEFRDEIIGLNDTSKKAIKHRIKSKVHFYTNFKSSIHDTVLTHRLEMLWSSQLLIGHQIDIPIKHDESEDERAFVVCDFMTKNTKEFIASTMAYACSTAINQIKEETIHAKQSKGDHSIS